MIEKQRLISAIYAATLSPDNFNALSDDLYDLVVGIVRNKSSDALPGNSQDNIQDSAQISDQDRDHEHTKFEADLGARISALIDPELRNHIDNAASIQNRIGHLTNDDEKLDIILKAVPNPAYVFDQNETIVKMNALATQRHQIATTDLSDLVSAQDGLEDIRAAISDGPGLSKFHSVPLKFDAASGAHALVKELEPDAEDGRQHRLFLLTIVDLGFDQSTKEIFQRAFNLTKAEAAIAVMLASGQSVNEIAQNRGASLATVRTQIRATKSKVGARDLPELVRLVYGFSAGVLVPARVMAPTREKHLQNLAPLHRQITLRDGRRMDYLLQGAAQGKPVLMVHNMSYGFELPRAAIQSAADNNIKIIAPYRPGYGASDMNNKAKGDDFLDAVADDFAELLDSLDIGRAHVLTHGVGSFHGLRFASRHPGRVAALTGVCHAPIWKDQWLTQLPKRQSLVMVLTRYFRRILPLYIWAVLSYLSKGNAEEMLRTMVKESSGDLAVLSDPEVVKRIKEENGLGLQQGPKAFCYDCDFTQRDFSKEARNTPHKMHLLHGAEDKIFQIEFMQAFVDAVPGTKLEVIEGAGNFLFYSHWDRILEVIKPSAR